MRRLLVVLAFVSVSVGGAPLIGAGPTAQAGECPPVVGCVDTGVCLKPDDPLNTTCEPMDEEERRRQSVLCVGGDNQRKPGHHMGVCIYHGSGEPLVAADSASVL